MPEQTITNELDVATKNWQRTFQKQGHFEVTEAPAFLQKLDFFSKVEENSLENIWFLTKAKIYPGKHSSETESGPWIPKKSPTPIKQKENKDPNADLDLTGSPLRCSFDLEEDFDDSFVTTASVGSSSRVRHQPMKTSQARSCLSRYIAMSNQNLAPSSTNLPFWTLCDGSDKTIFLGTHNRLLNGNKGKKLLTHHIVQYNGFKTSKELTHGLKEMKKKHTESLNGNVLTQIDAHSIYNLTSSNDPLGEQTFVNDLEIAPASNLQLHLQWKNPLSFLAEPSLDARVTLEAKVLPGDEKMATFPAYSELQALQNLMSGLQDRGIVWRGRDEEGKSMEEELVALMNKVRQEGSLMSRRRRNKRKENNETNNDSDESRVAAENVLNISREDIDFCDMLWNILHKSRSYDELKICLEKIFHHIKQEEFRPYFFSTFGKPTRLAEIVQVMNEKDTDVPSMEGRLPLEILVELGMEKLNRDYIHALMSSYLAGKDEMAPFLNPGATDQERLENLWQLHMLLELINLVQTFLSPTQDCLRSILGHALKRVKGHDCNINVLQKGMTFNFQISPAHIKDRIAKLHPSIWQCRLLSRQQNSTLEKVAHLSLEPPVDHVKENEPDDEMGKNKIFYYFLLKTSIKRELSLPNKNVT